MTKRNHINFTEWVAFVFGRETRNWAMDSDFRSVAWIDNVRLKLDHLVTLADSPVQALRGYSNQQIGWGLDWLFSSFTELGVFCGTDRAPPDRVEHAIRAVGKLGNTLIPFRCPKADPTSGRDELAGAYYMFWDVVPIWPSEQTDTNRRLLSVCLHEMKAVLAQDHPVCRFHALHGLGHFTLIADARPREIIDSWLATEPRTQDYELKYAEQARMGNVQ